MKPQNPNSRIGRFNQYFQWTYRFHLQLKIIWQRNEKNKKGEIKEVVAICDHLIFMSASLQHVLNLTLGKCLVFGKILIALCHHFLKKPSIF